MALRRKSVWILPLVVVVGAAIVGGVLMMRGSGTGAPSPAPVAEKATDSFTFFNLGPETGYNLELRARLDALLGDVSIATWTTIDLTPPGIDHYGTHFPRLQALNQALNYAPLQRIEHNTVRLTYRYARKMNVPFDRIRLVFSGQSGLPLFFRLYSKGDGSEFIKSIQQKYGAPKTIGNDTGGAHALYWRKKNALLIISITENRLGITEYHFGIYYLKNIAALSDAEAQARRKAQQEKDKTGKMAF